MPDHVVWLRGMRSAAIVALAGAALAVAACGSSRGGSSSTAPATATKAATHADDVYANGEHRRRRDRGAFLKVPAPAAPTSLAGPPANVSESAFLTAVFDDAQAMWKQGFEEAGTSTPRPR